MKNDIRTNIRLLGDLLGETIVHQTGPEAFEMEEEIRALAKKWRMGVADAAKSLEKIMPELIHDLGLADSTLKAFLTYFQLVNLAEERERVRVLRQREETAFEQGQPMDETIAGAVQTLKREGVTAAEMQTRLESMLIEFVFTAHPTESKRQTIREILRHITDLLAAANSRDLHAHERSDVLDRLRDHVTLLWQSSETRDRRPEVMDEVRNTGLYFFEHTLFDLVPRIYEEITEELAKSWPEATFRIPAFLRYGSWIGGDRDGNPYVTNEVTQNALRAQKEKVLTMYLHRVDELYDLLSVSRTRADFSKSFLDGLAADRKLASQDEHEVIERFDDEPYRQKLLLMFRRLRATRRDNELAMGETPIDSLAYPGPDIFLADLISIRESLLANKGEQLARGKLERLISATSVFGFHLATLDVRQHARHHRNALQQILAAADMGDHYLEMPETDRVAALGELLEQQSGGNIDIPALVGTVPADASDEDESKAMTASLVELFSLIRHTQEHSGEAAMQTYIISMTEGVSNLLEILVLATSAGLAGKIDIVPLFETVADLDAAPGIMRELFHHPVYKQHLESRGRHQQIMIGYSDSNKDGGFMRANWMLFTAQQNLATMCQEENVVMTLFHGRGGSLGRGGGPTNRAILSQPHDSVRGRIRITEQGEVVSSRYSCPAIARRHLEQVTHATLCSTSSRDEIPEIDQWSGVMDQLSESAYQKYRSLVDHPLFLDYFQAATPIDQIGQLNIGSRPSHRRATQTLDDLRAIPWVFAWTQSRANVPSWFGVGSGFDAWINAGDDADDRLKTLQTMYLRWPFFRTMLGNVHLGMGRACMAIAKSYASLASTESTQAIFGMIESEFELTRSLLLKVTGMNEILETEPWLQYSIRVRNPYVDPLNFMQVELLRELRGNPAHPDHGELQKAILLSINGIAAGLQNVG